ncbi:hypothetical protein B5X24_HaOG212088 [Helicoverpa armigera]|uniref:Uncharacterized protein n=1 Tax=Helicoverpa armigera TaxID=29058 RepID=A0A2W1BC30_HELAM|nr:hypothetical protein B5X24_HaOG212088 [Helicoverpa armigera]
MNVVPSNRHKKQKTNTKVEEESTTVPDFDFQWPDPDHVNDFEVPQAFRLSHEGRKDSGDAITQVG